MAKVKTSRPWSLPNLLKANRNAATLYVTLQWLAGGRRQLHTTRAELGKVCGLGKDTITAAMAALDKAGWITLRIGSDGTSKWYQVTLKSHTSLLSRKIRSYSGKADRRKNQPNSTSLLDRKNQPYSGGGKDRKNQPYSEATIEPEKPALPTVGRLGDAQAPSPLSPSGAAPALRSPAEPPPEPFISFENELQKLKPEPPQSQTDSRVARIIEAFDGRVVPEHERITGPYIPNPQTGEPTPTPGVPVGWTVQSWRERLIQLASRCEDVNPQRANELRTWAEGLS